MHSVSALCTWASWARLSMHVSQSIGWLWGLSLLIATAFIAFLLQLTLSAPWLRIRAKILQNQWKNAIFAFGFGPILEPLLGLAEASERHPKMSPKMDPNPEGKNQGFPLVLQQKRKIRSQGAESVSSSKKVINAVAMIITASQDFVKRALTGVPMTPRCRVQKRCAYQFLMCLDAGTAKWVPRTLRITFGSNCVLNFYRIWPRTCPGRSGAHLGQIVY